MEKGEEEAEKGKGEEGKARGAGEKATEEVAGEMVAVDLVEAAKEVLYVGCTPIGIESIHPFPCRNEETRLLQVETLLPLPTDYKLSCILVAAGCT
jgi:hypothetical protein